MISVEMATPELLETKVFWNKLSGVIRYVDDVTNKILSRDPNCIVDVFMWPKLGDSSICMKKLMITWILWEFDENNRFSCRVVLVQMGLALGGNVKLHTRVSKKKLKIKVEGLISTFVEVIMEKTGRGGDPFTPYPG